LALRRQPQEIYFHKGKKECDFILKKGAVITQAIQVCVNLSEEATRLREFEGLLEAMETYGLQSGWILTENDRQDLKLEGYTLHIRPIWEWLIPAPSAA
jgi:predicted AAA+ superfamily ATPase